MGWAGSEGEGFPQLPSVDESPAAASRCPDRGRCSPQRAEASRSSSWRRTAAGARVRHGSRDLAGTKNEPP
jgi:hypothetical protein